MAPLALVLGVAAPARAGELDIEAELAIPGVKLLVVDFYASWCGPCKEAIPKWEALRKKYGKRGLRLVAVAVRDEAAMCEQLPWTPDKTICDTEGAVAQRFGVEGLPAAFLWNWQGHMLGERIHPDEVEAKIDAWMAEIPRVSVEVAELPKRPGIGKRSLERLVASELNEAGKLTVVASAADRRRLRALAKESFRLGADEALTCDIGQEVSANNLLEVSIVPGNHPQLRLGLLSAESHCRTRDVAAPWDPRNPQRSVLKAVTKLMGRLRRPSLQVPAAPQVAAANLRAGTRAGRGASGGGVSAESAMSDTSSYEAILAEARRAEEQARKAKEEADRVRRARAERLGTAWTAVEKAAKTKALPKRDRAAILAKFLSDFPDDNPHAEQAEQWRTLLRAGKEPNAAPDGMVGVPAGEFFMGCNDRVDSDCDDDEKPGKRVHVAGFAIDRTEVTVDAYAACVRAGRCSKPDDGSFCNWGKSERGDHPINCVDWNQAKTFCEWRGARLPTEAEWEKAARGTAGRKYPWGNAPVDCDRAVRGDSGKTDGCGRDSTWPVGSRPSGASPYGALDMAGNVREWTADWYDRTQKYRVARGGGWFGGDPAALRASYRFGYVPSYRNDSLGFRCAHSS